MVQIDGCGRRSPFSSKFEMSLARTFSYGLCPYVNSSHMVTPATSHHLRYLLQSVSFTRLHQLSVD